LGNATGLATVGSNEPPGLNRYKFAMTPATLVAVKTVLVADDTAFVRDRFRTALEGAGHRAITVRTGGELLAAFREHHQERRQGAPEDHKERRQGVPADRGGLDLLVLDLRLPQGNGVAMLRSIRKIDPAGPPIVVFSGTIASADEVRQLSGLGVAGYVNEYTAVQHIIPSLTPHLFPSDNNRRSSPRVVLGIPVAYRYGNTIATALTLNISHGGIAVRTTNPLEPGSAVRARFRLPGGKDIEAEARIAWVDQRVGMGLQFTKVDSASQAAIDDFVQAHFFSNRKA
jgi:uncharacterized protein (TIGR02266 family)